MTSTAVVHYYLFIETPNHHFHNAQCPDSLYSFAMQHSIECTLDQMHLGGTGIVERMVTSFFISLLSTYIDNFRYSVWIIDRL